MLGFMTVKGVLNYAAMPQVVPRLRSLISGGFNYIPYFVAVVYNMVGLLPRNHPYLRPESFGRFGLRHVISQAAGNLKFSWKNIDQIILFVAVCAGVALFFIQFIALSAILLMQPVYAMPTNWNGFFVVANPSQDLAYMMLDMVFGVPNPSGVPVAPATVAGGIFDSCIGTDVPCQDTFTNAIGDMNVTGTVNVGPGPAFTPVIASHMSPLATDAFTIFPFPFHLGIHQIFSVYSTGLLVVAVIIASYFIATILAETAQSGTPFGRRFNKMWAPLRIVVAFGLLIPLNVGLNSSQYVVLYSAKYGSAFATNGWIYFNDVLSDAYLEDGQRLISIPRAPDFGSLTQFMHVAKACKVAYEYYAQEKKGGVALTANEQVWMYVIGPHSDPNPWYRVPNTTVSYAGLLTGYLNGLAGGGMSTLTIRFGLYDEVDVPGPTPADPTTTGPKYKEYRSFVKPVCGELRMELSDPRPTPSLPYDPTSGEAEYGAYWSQFFYWRVITHYWFNNGQIASSASPVGAPNIGNPAQTAGTNFRHQAVVGASISAPSVNLAIHSERLDDQYVRDLHNVLRAEYERLIDGSLAGGLPLADVMHDRIVDSTTYVEKGWAAAGIWYNRIAEINGIVTSSMTTIPEVRAYPEIMEKIYDVKTKYDKDIDMRTRFKPTIASLDSVTDLLDKVEQGQFANILWSAYDEWSTSADAQLIDRPKSNPFLQAISSLLGTDGLYDARNNPTTHPLAQLSGIGRSLVESSIRSLGFAAMSVGLTLVGLPKQLAKVSASFFVTVAMLGLTIGFVLFYVVPFLPFIYFYFAVGGWVKGIFEALVGAPLWALAHIRIDGHGMSGQAALNGYFLIFEVFVRPILIVFGLLASISIYSALVGALNNVFTLVTENASGYDLESTLEGTPATSTLSYMRSLIDEFFFTVIYAILVYMIGMSSFKLIDTIPNNILRWMGQSVATFGDQRENPAEGLVSRMSVGSQQVTSKIGGGLQAIAGAATSQGKK